MEAVLYAKQPKYPAQAQKDGWQGKGWFALKIGNDGKVSSVAVLHSTGHVLLDESAEAAFRQWRFRPGSIAEVRVPLTFWLGRLRPEKDHSAPQERGDCDHLIIQGTDEATDVITAEEAFDKQLLLFAARPSYPYEARRAQLSGSGIFDLKFDYKTGNLREIHVVKSTGVASLDGHAIGALKLWKAKPGTIHVLRVPVDYTIKSHYGVN